MRRREYKNFWRNCKLHYILNLVKTKLCPAVYTKTAYHFINLIKLCSMIDKFSIILTFQPSRIIRRRNTRYITLQRIVTYVFYRGNLSS